MGFTTKAFLEEYCILLGKAVYGNVDTALLCLILLAEYLVNEYNLKRIKAESCIFFRKCEKGKLEIVISVHMYDVFMDGQP